MRKKTRRKLSQKIAVICSVFAVVLSVSLGVLGFYTYYKNMMGQYEQYINTIINISSSMIDVEDMEKCIVTKKKSEQYEKTQLALNNVKEQSQVEFIYVIKPLSASAVDNAMYVWNAVTEEEIEIYGEIASLGDLSGEGFPQEMAVYFMSTMEGADEITYIPNKSEDFGYVLTGLYPLHLSDGTVVGIIGVDILMNQIYEDMNQYLVFVVVGTLVIGIVFLFLFLRHLNRKVAQPIIQMTESTMDFMHQSSDSLDPSQLEFKNPRVKTGDEIQLLSENLMQMTTEIIGYMGNLKQATAEKERISAELNVAMNIQSGMLPHKFPMFPERSEFDVYAQLKAPKEMDGSFYDLFLVDKNHLAVVMGEIAGKGIPAALLMVITKTLIKNYAQLGYSPDRVFAETNNQLSESNEGMLTTAFLGIVDLTTGRFTYVNAGHCVPMIKHAGKDVEYLPANNCFVLGSMSGVPYWQQTVQLVQGDLLFLYTKGLVEAENKEQIQYSAEHMQMRLNQAMGEVYDLKEIADVMMGDLEAFLNGAVLQKDIAMLLLRYFGM